MIKNKLKRRATPSPTTTTSEYIRFDIKISDLQELMQQQGDISVDKLEQFGGLDRLYTELYTSPDTGIRGNKMNIEYRRQIFGSNLIEPPKPKTYIQLILISLYDPILIFLEIGGIFSILASLFQNYYNRNNPSYNDSYDWIEGIAIIITVLIIVLVTATTDYEKEKQFRNLQDKLKNEQKIPVIRNGEIKDIPVKELVIGDICLIKYGNSIPADGIIIQSNDLKIDESSLTGESDIVIKDIHTDCIVLCGTNVMEGSAKIIIVAVGIYSQNGIILTLLGLTTTEPKDDISEVESGNLRKASLNITTLKQNRRTISNANKEMSIQNVEIDLSKNKSILQIKLLKLAYNISKGAIIVSILLIFILLCEFTRNFIKNDEKWDGQCVHEIIDIILTGISILVIAIPEGLPLAVTLALAYSVSKMTYDNNLVRNLAACETMGNATIICSDKTGTLTTNRMTCVELYTCEKLYKKIPTLKRLSDICGKLIIECISINSLYTSRLIITNNQQIEQIGNKTECALLGLVNELGGDYELIRTKYPENEFIWIYTFNSVRKSMSTVIKLNDDETIISNIIKLKDQSTEMDNDNVNDIDKDNSNANAKDNAKNNSNSNDFKYRLYTKGASEVIMYKCRYIYDINGQIDVFTNDMKRNMYNKVITPMANNGLRTISLAFRDFISISSIPIWENEDDIIKDLILLSVCGIEDPIRPEVPRAIRLCQLAGINVKMVTGDNKETAKSIATKCGIIKSNDNNILILESKDFNDNIRDSNGQFNQKKFDKVWPRLRVLARSSPIDKYILVKGIIDSKITRHREVVAVTGDGTNDGPALKMADVGFAMGIAGTDVAKGASDIIITDDNFYSIVKAVMWGRNVYDSIAKFIQFQLTVNLVAVIIAFTTAIYTNRSVIKAVQLLWVNLIMDSLASLALATERPTEQILKRKPYGRMKSIISSQMFVNILLQTIYQLIVLYTIFIYFDKLLNIPNGNTTKQPTKHYTLLFNALVVMTLFNEINSRKLNGELNVFIGIFSNYIFITIWIITFILQIIIVQYGSYVFHTKSLNIIEWIWCIIFGIGTSIWSTIYNRLPLQMYMHSIYYSCCKKDIHIEPENKIDSDDYSTPWSRTRRVTTQINVLNRLSAIKEENEKSRFLAAANIV